MAQATLAAGVDGAALYRALRELKTMHWAPSTWRDQPLANQVDRGAANRWTALILATQSVDGLFWAARGPLADLQREALTSWAKLGATEVAAFLQQHPQMQDLLRLFDTLASRPYLPASQASSNLLRCLFACWLTHRRLEELRVARLILEEAGPLELLLVAADEVNTTPDPTPPLMDLRAFTAAICNDLTRDTNQVFVETAALGRMYMSPNMRDQIFFGAPATSLFSYEMIQINGIALHATSSQIRTMLGMPPSA